MSAYNDVLDALDSAPIETIFKNSEDGDDPSEVWFDGPIAPVSWISAWTGRSESAIRRALTRLEENALVRSAVLVDAIMARRILAKNTRNRPISELHVQRLMSEMSSGRWQYNGEAIKWSVDDVLLDGQHRLTALSRMPDDFPAIPFLVVRARLIESFGATAVVERSSLITWPELDEREAPA